MNLMVRPMIPNFSVLSGGGLAAYIGLTILLSGTVLAAVLLSHYAANRFKGDKKKTTFCFAALTLPSAIMMFCFFGFAATTVRGIIFFLILILSSYEDIKTRECDDYMHLMIVIAAFIGTELTEVPGMFVSAMFAGGIMLLTVLVTKNNIGGADIKMAAVCSFMLGFERGVIGLVIGTLLAVVVNLLKSKDRKKGFPMIPYLAVGYAAVYFI